MEKLKFVLSNNTDNELKKIAIFLTKVFKKKFSFSYLKWLYVQNPQGKAISCNIHYKNKIIGHYAVIPTKIIINQRKYKSALSLNTAVDDNFKGRGFFKIMADKTFKQVTKKGISIIYGVSNNQSTKLFEKYFNFVNLGSLDVKIGFGQNNETCKKKIKIYWGKKSLNWRILHPHHKYNIVNYNKKFSINFNFKKLINIIMGNFANDKLKTNREKNNYFKNFLNLYIGIGKTYKKNLFYFNLPIFFRPSPLNFIIKNFKNKSLNQYLKRKNLHFQLLDFDAF